MERIENIGFGNLKLIQDPQQFCYGVDAVILSDFATGLNPDMKSAVDLGTGNGIIPFILCHKNKTVSVTGIDVQEQAIDLAKRSCKINGLDDRICFINADVLTLVDEGNSTVDTVTCNPPYFIKGGAIPSSNKAKFIARHETSAVAEDFIKAAACLLERKGHFFMVHRPSRLADLFYYCRKHGLEPKNMRLVVPKPGQEANIVLLHCIKGGGKELNVMKELAVYDENGNYSEEIQRIYERI